MSLRQKLFLNNILNLILPVTLVVIMANMWRQTRFYSEFGLYLLIVIFVGLIIINLLMTYLISRSIDEPIKLIARGINKIADGDLDFSLAYNSSNEFGVMISQINDLTIKLKQTLEENELHKKNQSEITASIVHDLKTPIANILGYCEGLEDGIAKTDEKKMEYIRIIHNRASALNILVNNLFIISKYDLTNVPPSLKTFDLTEFLDRKINELKILACEKDFSLTKEFDVQSVKVNADAVELERVIDNIIENSIKYKASERLVIDFRLVENKENNTIIIKIIDNGIGIKSGEEDLIFNQFYRNSKARTSGEGNGLGLYTAKKIITTMKGKIWCRRNVDKGITMFISFQKL